MCRFNNIVSVQRFQQYERERKKRAWHHVSGLVWHESCVRILIFSLVAERCDTESGSVSGPLWEAAGAPAPADFALPQTPPPLRALCRDDLWPSGVPCWGETCPQSHGCKESFIVSRQYTRCTVYWNAAVSDGGKKDLRECSYSVKIYRTQQQSRELTLCLNFCSPRK